MFPVLIYQGYDICLKLVLLTTGVPASIRPLLGPESRKSRTRTSSLPIRDKMNLRQDILSEIIFYPDITIG